MVEKIYSKRELKICPFCGQGARLFRRSLWNTATVNGRVITHGYRDHYEYYVQCDNVLCYIKPSTKTQDDIYRPADEAINMVINDWNYRA